MLKCKVKKKRKGSSDNNYFSFSSLGSTNASRSLIKNAVEYKNEKF